MNYWEYNLTDIFLFKALTKSEQKNNSNRERRNETMEINHKWVSAKKYAEETGLSPEKAVQMVHNGTLEGTQTEKRLLENQSV